MFYATKIIKRIMGLSLLAFVALCFTGPNAALAYPSPLPVDLLSAGNFVILGETAITTTAGSSIVGDIGISPNAASSITGFALVLDGSGTFSTSSLVTGKIYAADYTPPTPTTMTTAINDMTTAWNSAGLVASDETETNAGDISGYVLPPGVYKWSTNVNIYTDVTLAGSASDVWIFQIAGNLNIASGGSVPAGIKVLLSGGAQASNVFWKVDGGVGATLGTYSTFNGTILSAKQIILQTGAVLNGRALAQTQVTLDANMVTAQPPPGTPALGKAFDPTAILETGVSTLTITLSNPNLSVATLSAALVDTLPPGVVIAPTPAAGTTCGSGIVTAIAGGTTVTLSSGSTILADDICTVTVDVTAAADGSYVNTLPAGALQTDQGNNAFPATATLNVSALGDNPSLG